MFASTGGANRGSNLRLFWQLENRGCPPAIGRWRALPPLKGVLSLSTPTACTLNGGYSATRFCSCCSAVGLLPTDKTKFLHECCVNQTAVLLTQQNHTQSQPFSIGSRSQAIHKSKCNKPMSW